MVRSSVAKLDRKFFEEDINKFTVKDFNRLCAPSSSHPISEESHLRCQRIYKAIVNPVRNNINLSYI